MGREVSIILLPSAISLSERCIFMCYSDFHIIHHTSVICFYQVLILFLTDLFVREIHIHIYFHDKCCSCNHRCIQEHLKIHSLSDKLPCCRMYLVAGASKQIQINGVRIMVMVRAMIPMPMELLKIHQCTHTVDMPVMANILNRYVILI